MKFGEEKYMSRIGKLPILIPDAIKVTLEGAVVKVVGPKGESSISVPKELAVSIKEGALEISKKTDTPEAPALWGTYRALIANMVTGVMTEFSKTLELVGVGYRASKTGEDVTLLIGFSHPVVIKPPKGVTLNVPDQTTIEVSGIDKNLVGQVAANIRKVRKPEPYKGKGIRYRGEVIKRKAGKAGKVGA